MRVISEKRENKLVQRPFLNQKLDEEYDVVVAGLGTAGAIAAITAAREGLNVLGIEQLTSMGGMATNGSVLGYYFGSSGGIYEEIDQRANQYNGSVYTFSGGSFGAESKRFVLEDELQKAGGQVAYQAVCTGVLLEGSRVIGVRYIQQGVVKTVLTKVVIDGTGNGEICEMAGCRMRVGRELDSRTQPFTSVRGFVAENRIRATNFDGGMIVCNDAVSYTNAILSAHANHFEVQMKKEEQMLYLAPLIGVREGKRIVGEMDICLCDVFADKTTLYPVCYAYADLDKHGWDNAFENQVLQDWWVGANLGAVCLTIPVPYGSLIPQGFDGILATGRCISQDRDVHSCVRMMRDMQKLGEAAAVMAKLVIDSGCKLANIPYDSLKERLERTGCLNIANDLGVNFETFIREQAVPITWLTDLNSIKIQLDSQTPGVAIWSLYRLRADTAVVAQCRKWLDCTQENLRYHTAFALGLMRDAACLPQIRQMIVRRDTVRLVDCRKNNQFRLVMAVFMAGKLRDRDACGLLLELLDVPREQKRDCYTPYKRKGQLFICNELYFQVATHTIRALLEIGKVHTDLCGEIAAQFGRLKTYLKQADFASLRQERGYHYMRYLIEESIPFVLDMGMKLG